MIAAAHHLAVTVCATAMKAIVRHCGRNPTMITIGAWAQKAASTIVRPLCSSALLWNPVKLMKLAETLIVCATGLLAVSAAATGTADSYMPGVAKPERAHSDYILKCQGCHRPDGGGDAVSNPPLNGMVAKFLSVPGGREFLGRVPGVASVDLSDERLADVLNWTLSKFDSANLPTDFRPYSPSEIGQLRQVPLRTERAALRQSLVDQMQE